jgi:uncharacterized membrane protein
MLIYPYINVYTGMRTISRPLVVALTAFLLFIILFSTCNIGDQELVHRPEGETRADWGVDLSPKKDYTTSPPNIESMIKETRPGSSVSYNISVRNTGNATDKFFLKVEGVPPNWKAKLDTPPDSGNPNPDYVWVFLNGMVNVTLWVTAPWEGRIGELAQINVTGNSSHEPLKYDKISTITIMDGLVDFKIAFTKEYDHSASSPMYGYKWDKIAPGSEGVYAIAIRNLGFYNDTYEIEILDPPEGWGIKFIDSGTNKTQVTLMASIFETMYSDPIQTTINIKVKCPENATVYDGILLHLRAVSLLSLTDLDYPLEDEDHLMLDVGLITGLRLSCDDPQKETDEDGVAEFEIEVENLSNDEIDVVFSYEGLLDRWRIDLPDERPLLIGQTMIMKLTITAPADALGGQTVVMEVTGKIRGRSHIMDAVTLNIINKKYFEIEMNSKPDDRTVNPGETVIYTMDVKNKGNCRDMLTLSSLVKDPEISVKFLMDDNEVTSTDILAGASREINVSVKTPSSFPAGRYWIEVRITGQETTEVNYITLNVNKTYDLKVRPYPFYLQNADPQRTSAVSEAGGETKFVVEVFNDADYPDTANLSLWGLDDEWYMEFETISSTPDGHAEFKDIKYNLPLPVSDLNAGVCYRLSGQLWDTLTLHLEPKQSAWVGVNIQAPADAPDNVKRTVTVVGESLGGNMDEVSDNRASIDITVDYPEPNDTNTVYEIPEIHRDPIPDSQEEDPIEDPPVLLFGIVIVVLVIVSTIGIFLFFRIGYHQNMEWSGLRTCLNPKTLRKITHKFYNK